MPLLLAIFSFLARLIGVALTFLVSFFFEYLSKRLAIVAAVVAGIAALTGAFFLAISSLIQSVAPLLPPQFNQACSLVVPDNFPALVSIVFSAHVLRFAYEWNVKVLHMKL